MLKHERYPFFVAQGEKTLMILYFKVYIRYKVFCHCTESEKLLHNHS